MRVAARNITSRILGVVVVRDAADNIIITLSANPATEDRAADFTTEERERAVKV
jgi:hypothetical protein